MEFRLSRASAASSALLLVVICGCGDSNIDPSAEDETRASGLRWYGQDNQPVNDPNLVWRNMTRLVPSSGTDITHQLAPVSCAGAQGFFITSVDTTGHYRTLQRNNMLGNASSWANYGPRTFASKPSCTSREDDTATGRSGFVLAGKGTDGKIYASPGAMGSTFPSLQNPAPVAGTPGNFAAVNGTTFTTGGNPAMATGGGFGGAGTGVVLVFMNNALKVIQGHFRALPYMNNSWSSVITGPQLPTNWTAVGAPAITKGVVTFTIVVHAVNGSQHRLFRTFFYTDGTPAGSYFSQVTGSPSPTWEQLADLGSIEQDPSIDYSDYLGLSTVYFKRGTQIMQTSQAFGSNPVLAVKPDAGVCFASAPYALASIAVDQGSRLFVARAGSGSNCPTAGIYWAESTNEEFLGP